MQLNSTGSKLHIDVCRLQGFEIKEQEFSDVWCILDMAW